MELGQSFPSAIETAINCAAVQIAIFSKRYAESPWCLAELLLMLQSPAKIIPIFYEVEPSALRYIEKGIYGHAFIGYQKKSRYLDKLHKWKEALQSISFTAGYEMNDSNIGDHKSILSAVQREVQRIKPLHVAKYPVALDKLVQEFERRCLHNLVQDFETHCGMNKEEEGKAKIVGIFGMGGVGKTTLSKELFNRKRQQYARACFLFDVREASSRCKLPSLQTKFLKDLFGEKDLCFQSTEEGLSCISNCISSCISDCSTEMSSCLLLLHLWYPYVYSRPYSLESNHPRHVQHESLRAKPGIPSCIPLQHMQCLRISNGYFKRLWSHDVEAPSQLKTLEIHRIFLEEYPDFLGIITHVEKKPEEEVNEGKKLSKIKSLIVKTNRRLSGTPPTTYTRDSSSFKAQLDGGRQSATVKVPLCLLEDLVINEQENIKGIALNGTYIPGLRSLELSSMKNLIEGQFARVEKLNRLSVSKCEFLEILSVTSDLTKLEALSISACPMLKEPNLGHLTRLKKIRIADCNMDSVPGLSSFEMLVELNVSRCPKLHELCLAHLSCLEKLEVKNCDLLKGVTGLSDLQKLAEVSISWCWTLQLNLHLVGLNSLKRI